jgi:hypothetical protein
LFRFISEAVNEILYRNGQELDGIVNKIKDKSIDDTELILRLSVIRARDEVLEEITDYLNSLNIADDAQPEVEELTGKRIKPPVSDNVPSFIAEVENDNPEQEDKDAKKAREEEHGFFG